MSAILTKEAAEGFDHYREIGPLCSENAAALCPYLHSSPAAMAWYLGRHMARSVMHRPTPDAHIRDASRVAVTAGRGDTLSLRGRCDILLARFAWRHDNSFSEVRS